MVLLFRPVLKKARKLRASSMVLSQPLPHSSARTHVCAESEKQLAAARERIKELEDSVAHMKAEQEKREVLHLSCCNLVQQASAHAKGERKMEDEIEKEKVLSSLFFTSAITLTTSGATQTNETRP